MPTTKSKPRAKAKGGDDKGAEPKKESGTPAPGRPIWKGSISFGLVNVPVTLFSLEKKSSEVSFKLLDSRNQAGIRYKRVNEDTGEEVPWDQIVKGYEYSEGQYVVLNDEDFAKVEVEATQTIEISDFVDREEIDDTFFDKPYILVPGKKAEKGYVLLREALKNSGRVGIAKVVIRTREYLSAVSPKGNALILNLMRFSDELRRVNDFKLPDEPPEEYRISERELKLAEQLVESMSRKWEPGQYRDDYRDALMKFIEERAEKGEMAAVRDTERKRPESANVIDLAELLRRSMESASKNGKAPKKGSSKKKAS
jgi:DNA end-binding protein Ku